jgi:ligand-binding sensor domain-containing protein
MKPIAHSSIPGYLVFMSAVAVLCISFSTPASNLTGQTYSSSDFSIAVMISDDQAVWAGTNGQGLLRFNKLGGAAEIFTSTNSELTSDDIRGLAFDSTGALLIGTLTGGIMRFNDSTWEKLPPFSGQNVTGVCVDGGGRIWASTNSGVYRLINGSWEIVINRINGTLTVDQKGDLWVYDRRPESECSSGFIYEYLNGGLNRTITLDRICPETVWPYYFTVDGKKNAWLGGGQRLLKINESVIDSFVTRRDTQPEQISALAVNHNEVLMVALKRASGSTEIHLYNQINGKGIPFDSAAVTLPGFSSVAACADRDGSFFCAGLDGSIIRIGPSGDTSSINRGLSILPSNSVTSLVVDKSGALWAGTGKGIVQFTQNAWSVYPQSGDTMPGNDVSSLSIDSSGAVWAGFQQNPIMSSIRSGLASFNNNHWHRFALDHYSVKSVVHDREGTLWTVCDNGVYRYHNGAAERLFETVSSSVREIALGTNVHTLAFDKNNIPWIGTGLGIKKYIDGVWIDDSTTVLVPPVSTESRWSGAIVNTLSFDCDGTLWAGTGRGLVRYSSGACTTFDTTEAVLPDNIIQCIAFDTTNSVWVGTKRGLVKLGPDQADHQTYTTANSSLRDNDITALALTKNGDLWIGTRLGGLTRFLATSIASLPSVSVLPKHHSKTPTMISFNTQSGRSCKISINIGHPATTRLTLLSMDGKTIRSFNCTYTEKTTIVWDGLDKYNRQVPGGLYLGILSERGKIISSRVLPMP